jgi:hypothetical protein
MADASSVNDFEGCVTQVQRAVGARPSNTSDRDYREWVMTYSAAAVRHCESTSV